jgi:hypothetical protein
MKNIIQEEWEFKGNKYKIGKSLNEEWDKNTIYPIVWFQNKLYEACIKPEAKPKLDRIGLWCIYNKNKKPYWTTIDKVYQIIKL